MSKKFYGLFAVLMVYMMVMFTGCADSNGGYGAAPVATTTTTTTTTTAAQPAFAHPAVSGCTDWEWDRGEQQWYCDDDDFNYGLYGGFFYWGGGWHTVSHYHSYPVATYVSINHVTFAHSTSYRSGSTTYSKSYNGVTKKMAGTYSGSSSTIKSSTTTKSSTTKPSTIYSSSSKSSVTSKSSSSAITPPKSSSGTGTVVRRSSGSSSSYSGSSSKSYSSSSSYKSSSSSKSYSSSSSSRKR